MINPLKKKEERKKKGCKGGEKKQKVFKINVNLFASHLFPFFRDNFALILI